MSLTSDDLESIRRMIAAQLLAQDDKNRKALTNAVQPLQEQLDALRLGETEARASTQKEIARLNARDEKHSGQHRLVTGDLSAFKEQTGDKILGIVQELAARQARAEHTLAAIAERSEAAQIEAKDPAGRVLSIRPASIVAAESSVRTEDKQREMEKTVDATEETTRKLERFVKRVLVPMGFLVPIIVEIIKQLFLPH